jgi:hypothetical protein
MNGCMDGGCEKRKEKRGADVLVAKEGNLLYIPVLRHNTYVAGGNKLFRYCFLNIRVLGDLQNSLFECNIYILFLF